VTGRVQLVLAGAVLCALVAAPLAAGEPIPIRDQNPLIRGLYLPVPGDEPPATGRPVQRFILTVSNTTNIERPNGESIWVDGESLELRWLFAWQPTEGLQVRFTLPVVHYGGGAFDGLVDQWHDLLGLSGGWRPRIPGNDFIYYYGSPDGTLYEADGGTALGDGALEAGVELRQTERSYLNAWFGLEAPTGDSSRLTGNDAWDFGTWLEGGFIVNGRTSLDARAGLVRPGSAAPLPLEPQQWVPFGTVGATWNATPALGLRLQVDAHGRMLEDTDLRFLGEAVQLTLGAEYRSAGGWRWQLALSEDVLVNASPDFAIQLGVQIGGGSR
jgi:hypothetical protein